MTRQISLARRVPARIKRAGQPVPSRPGAAGLPEIALCTHSLSIGNIEPRAIPYGRESVKIGILWRFAGNAPCTGVCDEYRKWPAE